MGDNLDKKKYGSPIFFHQESIYEISKHYHTWYKTYSIAGMHMKAKRLNSQKLQRAITPIIFHLLVVNLIRWSPPQSQSVYQISRLWLTTFWDILLMRFQCYFITREITLKWEIILIRKKYGSPIFSWEIHLWNFRTFAYMVLNMLCTWKQQMAKNCKGP